jgi:hypothetical protein
VGEHKVMADLKEISIQFRGERKRAYAKPFNDWPGGYTSCHAHPVVYALWSTTLIDKPLYIGHTTDLGKRLDIHHKRQGWSHPFTHASFVES